MRTRLKDAALDAQFEKDGYIIIPNWISQEQLANLKQIYAEVNNNFQFENSIMNTLLVGDKDLKESISKRVMEQLKPTIDKYFVDYLDFFSYYLIKPSSPDWVNFHRDSSIINEDKFEYLTIWLPLDDVTENNGCIYIVPGSHKLFTYQVPISLPWPYPQLDDTLKKHAVDVPMKAGDLLLFYEKTLHGSYPNQSGKPRHVISTALLHPETEAIYYYHDQATNTVKEYEVDPWFYFRGDYSEPIGKHPLKRSYTFDPPAISPKAVDKFYGKDTAGSGNPFSKVLQWLGVK